MSFLTPTEILENNPEIAKNWDAQKIGYLYPLKLVRGKKNTRRTLINEHDVIKIYNLILKS